jgi:hypothetical protein
LRSQLRTWLVRLSYSFVRLIKYCTVRMYGGWMYRSSGRYGEEKILAPYRYSNFDPSAIQPLSSHYTECATAARPVPNLIEINQMMFKLQHVDGRRNGHPYYPFALASECSGVPLMSRPERGAAAYDPVAYQFPFSRSVASCVLLDRGLLVP